MRKIFVVALLATLFAVQKSNACTNLIVTKGASTDGSVMVTYAADSHQLYGALYHTDAAKYNAGAMLKIYEWDTGKYMGEIPQIAQTYNTIGNMNEHQLIISETTYGGRQELYDSTAIMDYGSLIYVTLQRAKTAREAIKVFVDLANTYGYASSGESLTFADANEAWIVEIIGKGCKIVNGKNVNRGIVWVARLIPDGYICAHANHARITQFPLNDPANCMYAPDVISFAREMGYFKGKDKDFSFTDAYAPLDFSAMRGCEARVWSFFRKHAADMDKYSDYAMGHNKDNRMPLWVKPSAKVAPKQVMDAMRDHYEGTPMDMTTDLGAGASACPYRWRPMGWDVDGVEYVNERAVATQQTGFWFVGQARAWLADAIGGILWFGVDDAGTSCLSPIYTSSTRVAECISLDNGNMMSYSPTSSFWLFNRVTNLAYSRYDKISKDILSVVNNWENRELKQVRAIDAAAEILYKENPEMAVNFLTDYSVNTAQALFNRWVELDRYLLVKYIDGNMKKEDAHGFKDNGNGANIPAMPDFPGYNDKWKRAVAKDNGEILKVIK